MGDRTCYNCGQGGHIARNCPEVANNEGGFQPRSGGGGGYNRPKTCYNCGLEGHISRNCPTAPEGGVPGGAGGASGGRTCYNCGEPGHISRDCPSEPMQQDGQDFGQRRRGSRPKCYNCGEFGHISRECPQKDAGPKCYNCGNFGHISGACPEPPRAEVENTMGYDAGAVADQTE